MARRLPPLNALRSFEAAARHGSFAKAAEELFVTHGAVSRAIRHLEDDLNLVLFERATRKVTLTPVGSAYAAAIRDILDRLATATVAATQDQSAGVLSISTLDSFAAKWLVPRLFRFRRLHPEIDVRLATSDALANMVTDGIDIALRYGGGRWGELTSEPLLRVEVFPACSPRLLEGPPGLRQPEDLRHHTLIHDDFEITWEMWLRSAGVEVADARRGPMFLSSDHAIQAAIQGEGVVLARSALVAEDLRQGRLVKPFALTLSAETAYYVVYPPRALERPKVRAFRDWVLSEKSEGITTGAQA